MRFTEKEVLDMCSKRNLRIITSNSSSTNQNHKSKGNNKKDFDSVAEENFYNLVVAPKLSWGELVMCETHKSFIILEKNKKYGLKEKKFTPDFILHYSNGDVVVVEMKGKKIKKLQRDFQLRKHLFIEKYCAPNNWEYRELESEQWSNVKGGRA